MFKTRKDSNGRMRARVTRTLAGGMLREAALYVGGDAGVQAAATTFEQIDVPVGHVAIVAMG